MPQKDHIRGLLAFYSLWNYPLTFVEIRKFFPREGITEQFLQQYFPYFEENRTLYFSTSADQKLLQARRKEAEQSTHRVRQKAEQYIKILKFFPFVRAIALVNTGAMGVCSPESDIDLFIVSKPSRIWTTRFMVTVFFHLLGVRASKTDTAGKFCLSFFASEHFTDFQQIKHPQDIYLALWIATLQPYMGQAYFQKLAQHNQSWVEQECGIGAQCFALNSKLRITDGQYRDKKFFAQKFFEFCCFFLPEVLFRCILLKTSRKFRDQNSLQYAPDMIFTDQIQKLHNPDLRQDIQKKWQEQIHS